MSFCSNLYWGIMYTLFQLSLTVRNSISLCQCHKEPFHRPPSQLSSLDQLSSFVAFAICCSLTRYLLFIFLGNCGVFLVILFRKNFLFLFNFQMFEFFFHFFLWLISIFKTSWPKRSLIQVLFFSFMELFCVAAVNCSWRVSCVVLDKNVCS